MTARLRSWSCIVLVAFTWLWLPQARAGEATPTAADPALEARVNALAAELRCLVCQNQSLADSHADLALDLKKQVREQMRSGRTDEQIVEYMTQRYGDFVLYRPPFKATTVLLWAGPLLLVLLGGALLWRALRGRTRNPSPDALSDEELRRARSLLSQTQPSPGRETP